MRPKSIGVLFAAAVLLTAYYAVFERGAGGVKIGPVFTGIEYADIVELELEPGAIAQSALAPSPPVLLRKDGDGTWWIQKPPVLALQSRLGSIVWGIRELQEIASVPDAEAATAFDSRGPESSIRFRTREGDEHRVEVGRDHPTLDLCYARLDRRKLFLTRKEFKRNLQSRLDDLRSRAIFPIPKERAARLEVAGNPLSAKVVRREGETEDWRFVEPQPVLAGREEIARILDGLNAWQATSFVRDEPGDLAPFGLDRPRLTIAIIERDGKRTSVQVGGDAPEKGRVYVAWEGKPFVMTAPSDPIDDLDHPAEELYSRYVLQFGAEEIQEVKAKIGTPTGREFILRRPRPLEPAGAGAGAKPAAGVLPPQSPRGDAGGRGPADREGESWELVEADGSVHKADRDHVRSLIDSLKFLQVKRYVPAPEGPAPETGLGSPDASVEVLTDAGVRRTLSFGRPSPGAGEAEANITNVAVDGEKFVFQTVTLGLVDLMKGSPWFMDRRISKIDPSNLTEFLLTSRGGEETTWAFGKLEDVWRPMVEGPFQLKGGATFEEGLVRKIASILAREGVLVEEWRPEEKDMAALGISEESFRFRIYLTEIGSGYQGFRKIYIGKEAAIPGGPATRWARVDEPGLRETPFLIDASFAGVLVNLVDHMESITEPATGG
jgi:hypothetical protein